MIRIRRAFQLLNTHIVKYLMKLKTSGDDILDITKNQSFGVKHDTGKVDLTYMSMEWITLHCRVRMFGAKKYSRNNWMLGFLILRSLAAALRHIFAFMWGEDNDPESGICHLGHASNCLEHAYHDFLYRKQNDDRTKSLLFEDKNGKK